MEEPGQLLAQKEYREIRTAQRQDKVIDKWRIAVMDQKMPKTQTSKEDLAMRKQFKNFKLKRGILFRTVKDEDQIIDQLVVPTSLRNEILKSLHSDMGHPGQERTLRLIRDRFYWPGITADVSKWITSCDRCIRRKGKMSKEPLINVNSSYPLELVCIDFLTLEPSKGNIGNILVITDHYTKFAKAVPTRNQTAHTTAEALFNEFFVHFGIPTRIHSDQGANFESQVIQELCNLLGIKKSHTTPYHPEGNAGPERFNRTLLNMLGTLEEEHKRDWKQFIKPLVFYYNCIPHETTRTSPYELLFGRKPKLPVDLVFGQAKDEPSATSVGEYLEDLQMSMEKAHQIALKHSNKAKLKQKTNFDKKAKAVKLSTGDTVLVKKLAFEGKHKIADKFESDTYVVIKQPRYDIPVFKVKSKETGRERTLHRNHLFLIHNQNIDDDLIVGETMSECDVMSDREDASQEDEIGDVTTDRDSDSEYYDCAQRVHMDGDAHDDDDDDDDDNILENQLEELEETPPSNPNNVSIDLELPEDNDVISVGTSVENDKHFHDNSHLSFQEEPHGDITETEENMLADEDKEVEPLPPEDEELPSDDNSTTGNKLTEPIPSPRPVPTPRRTARQRKPPDRYGDYLMYRVTEDTRIQALDILVKSGILSEVDTLTAHKLVETVMKS